jgi:hypothetical protein
MSRVRDLDNVGRTSSGGDRDTETEEETASHELVNAGGLDAGDLDDDADNDDKGANSHTSPTTPGIDTGADTRDSNDRANLVHGGNNT